MPEKSTFQKLREDEREVRKELIIQAAMALFEKKPINKIGMRDIAKRAGISAAAIYRYFQGRDDILVEAIIKHIRGVERRLETQLADGETQLETVAVACVDYLLDNESLFQMMGHFMITGKINSRALTKFNAVQRYFFTILDKFTQKAGFEDGVRICSHAFYASMVGVVMTFRNYPGRSKEEIRKHIHRLTRLVSQAFVSNIGALNQMAGAQPMEHLDHLTLEDDNLSLTRIRTRSRTSGKLPES